MPSALEGLVSLISVLALGVSFYNVRRAREIARRVDSLQLDERRFEVLRTGLDLQAMQIRQRTTLSGLRFRAQIAKVGLPASASAASRENIDNSIVGAGEGIAAVSESLKTTDKIVREARELTGRTSPTPDMIQETNAVLQRIKTLYTTALVEGAAYDELVAEGDHNLQAAQI